MTAYLKSEAPQEFRELIQRLERQSDGCFENLLIYEYPKNAAIWAILTHSVQLIENAAITHGYGSQRQREAMANLARASALAIEWIRARGNYVVKASSAFHLTLDLQEAARRIIQTAHNYLSFVSNFSLWHRDGVLAEATAATRVKFTNPGGSQQRRVRAYQQGVRPPGLPATVDNPAPAPIMDPRISAEILKVLERSQKKGSTRFAYIPPIQIYRDLTQIYSERLTRLFRRDLKLNLGTYDLDDFRNFYAALLGICALHENICYLWMQKHGMYPADSSVLIRRVHEWVRLISDLSRLTEQKTENILDGVLTGASASRPVDLHIHPFVSAEDRARKLYLVPHFPLHARPDENALRVCSYITPKAYDVTSQLKEEETRRDLKAVPTKFRLDGPLPLPNGLPDIDLIVQDSASDSVAIVELKWIRKTVRAVEHMKADEQLRNGIQQLTDISANPGYLSQRGILSYAPEWHDVHFLLVARDHFRWIESSEGLGIVAYDPFKRMLSEATELGAGIKKLMEFNWLPVEGRDFTVQHEAAEANGVTIEVEVFHRTKGFAQSPSS